MFEIYTSQIYKGGGGFKGSGKLDVTVGTAKEGRIFAPDWNMVLEHKQAMKEIKADIYLSEEDRKRKMLEANGRYSEQYKKMMRESYRKHREIWENVLRGYIPGIKERQDRVVFCCYCPPSQFCHRKLLAQMFVKLGERIGIPAVYYGEIRIPGVHS